MTETRSVHMQGAVQQATHGKAATKGLTCNAHGTSSLNAALSRGRKSLRTRVRRRRVPGAHWLSAAHFPRWIGATARGRLRVDDAQRRSGDGSSSLHSCHLLRWLLDAEISEVRHRRLALNELGTRRVGDLLHLAIPASLAR